MESSDYQQQTIQLSCIKSVPKPPERPSRDIYIPIEIISNILSRLPVPTVLRYRSVCKSWSQLTRTQVFIHQHLENSHKNETNHGSFILIQNSIQNTVAYYSSQGHSRSVNVNLKKLQWGYGSNHCNGLVWIIGNDFGYTFLGILNPVVDDELFKLPYKGMTKCQVWHACPFYDSYSNKYKVIRLFFYIEDDGDCTEMGVEVLTLGDDAWRQIGRVPIRSDDSEQVDINGCMHWLTYEGKILCFKIRDENISLIECPAWDDEANADIDYLIDYEGCLCVVRSYWPPLKMKFVIMEDYVNRVWREHDINLEQIVQTPSPQSNQFAQLYLAVGAHNGKLILENIKGNELYYYDPKTKSFEQCDNTPQRELQFKESLISAKTILCGET